MQQQLQQLSNTNMPWAAQRAQYALQVGQAVQQGQLSPGEAKEILADLINAENGAMNHGAMAMPQGDWPTATDFVTLRFSRSMIEMSLLIPLVVDRKR